MSQDIIPNTMCAPSNSPGVGWFRKHVWNPTIKKYIRQGLLLVAAQLAPQASGQKRGCDDEDNHDSRRVRVENSSEEAPAVGFNFIPCSSI
jgi:hypothetical protein